MSLCVGPAPRPGIRYGRRPGAYGVVLCGRGLLLTVGPGGEVQLPGGGIDPGEGPAQALRREALEETGWTVRPLRRIALRRRFDWIEEEARHAEKVMHVLLARALRRSGPPSEPGHMALVLPWEAAAARLAPPGEAALVASLRSALARQPKRNT